jgi:Cd2+/Zn2+-exporting ATPase
MSSSSKAGAVAHEVREPEAKESVSELELHVAGMNCPDCVRRAEDRLEDLEGVRAARGDHVARRLHVAFDAHEVDGSRIRAELGSIGFVARPAEGDTGRTDIWSTPMAVRTYVSGAAFLSGLLLAFLGTGPAVLQLPWADLRVPDLLFLAAAIVGGWNFIPAGFRSLRALSLDMNFLMTLAILGAVGIGEFLEAGAIAFLFSLAELLEGYAVDRARRSIHALLDLSPDRATVVRDDAEVTVSAQDLVPGDVVRVRRGEKIPGDGRVASGAAAVNQSMITGESLPVDLAVGDEVFAGTINTAGFLEIVIERAADETTLANIVRIVEEAERRKSRSERFVRTFARYYTPSVAASALLVVAVPTLLLGQPFSVWFVRGLTLLVIACPCALVISTPVAVVSGITAAARNGVLIKGGEHLETMGRVRVIAFDKTGTLTHGHPAVTDVVPLEGTEETVLSLAASIEARSEHPIGKAIVAEARERDVALKAEISDFDNNFGMGAAAVVNGRRCIVGAPHLFSEESLPTAALESLSGQAKTVVCVGPAEAPVGLIALADQPRDEARGAIQTLRRAGVERVVMLTGDNRHTAQAIAGRLGIDAVYAELQPEEKVRVLERLEADWGVTAMVGDGINDGPALAVASIGIAMGAAGSDVALETADVALMADDLSRLPYLYDLSRAGGQVIRQNIGASLLTKLTLAIGVPFGWVSLVTAVLIGDMGASLAVTLNSLRLARVRPTARGAAD